LGVVEGRDCGEKVDGEREYKNRGRLQALLKKYGGGPENRKCQSKKVRQTDQMAKRHDTKLEKKSFR